MTFARNQKQKAPASAHGAGVQRPSPHAHLRGQSYAEQSAQVRPPAGPTAHAASAQPTFAKEDAYNKAKVHNNTGTHNHGRPGIAVGKQIDFPVLHEASVFAGDLRTEIGSLHVGSTVRANPATARTHAGKRYLMVWARGHGGGWIEASAVEHGAVLAGKSKHLGSWQPAKGPPNGKLMHFREPAEYVEPHGQGMGSHLNPFQKHDGGLIEHHGLRGKAWDLPVYNVFLSLPQHDAAAVARDIALPGNSFRVVTERTVPTYGTGGSVAMKPVVFCYGYVSGDPKRRGWVMRACLK